MATQYGFAAVGSLTTPGGNTPKETSPYSIGRVRNILLDNSNPQLFAEAGGWSGIGLIEFDDINLPDSGFVKEEGSRKGSKNVAYPFFPNQKFYPVVGEIVMIFAVQSNAADQEKLDKVNYYLPSINIWNNTHHNSLPDDLPPPSQVDKGYEETEVGVPTTEPTEPEGYTFGKTFIERSDIRPLLPYEGDHIIEGRWGNSIRIGSTVKNATIPNSWSTSGEEGDPLIILRNGQTSYNDIPTWRHIVEDINQDKSSIYMTSTQRLPFFPSSDIRDSFNSTDTVPPRTGQYSGKQILLNSGRLTLNASTDSVVISSPNVIHLSAGKSINLDSTSKVVISTNELYLGDRGAQEKVILGDRFFLELQKLMVVLEGLAKACTNSQAGGYPVVALNAIGPTLEEASKDLRKILEDPNSPALSQNIKVK